MAHKQRADCFLPTENHFKRCLSHAFCVNGASCRIHTGRWRERLLFTLNGVMAIVAELNCGSVVSLHWRCSRQKFKSFQIFKRQCRRLPIRSPYVNTLVQMLANPVHATPEKQCDWLLSLSVASSPSFSHALCQALMPMPRVNGV